MAKIESNEQGARDCSKPKLEREQRATVVSQGWQRVKSVGWLRGQQARCHAETGLAKRAEKEEHRLGLKL